MKTGKAIMRRATAGFILGAALLGFVAEAEARIVRLTAGGREEVIDDLGFDVARVRLTGEDYVDVEQLPSGRGVRLIPLAPGVAELRLFDASGKAVEEWSIRITEQPPISVEAVQEFLKDETGRPISTLFCSEIPGTGLIKITGVVRELGHYDRIRKAVETFDGSVVNLAQPDQQFFATLADRIKKTIPIPGLKVSHAGDRLFLTGLVYSEGERAYVDAVARSIYPNVDNFLAVRPEGVVDRALEKPLIQLECQILELTYNAARSAGIDWGGLLPMTITAGWQSERGGGGPTGFVSLDTQYLINALIPQIQNGEAKVLYTQNLVCEDGEQARFFAGGSFWITATSGSGDISIEEVEFGITMELQPAADKFQTIGTAVNIEFSTLGDEINGYPSLLKRYVRTSVNVKRGQTLSISSLQGSNVRESLNKMPMLGDIPVLGQLFESKRFQEGTSEMVIFITPRLVVPGDPSNTALRERVEEQMSR